MSRVEELVGRCRALASMFTDAGTEGVTLRQAADLLTEQAGEIEVLRRAGFRFAQSDGACSDVECTDLNSHNCHCRSSFELAIQLERAALQVKE